MKYTQNSEIKEEYPFRVEQIKKSSQKRIDYCKNRSISSFHTGLVFCVLPFVPKCTKYYFSFLWGVVKEFFLLQFFQQIHLTHYPIKHVDHELDEKVPFTPERLPIYMDFIKFWIRPMEMLIHRFGLFDGAKLCAEFFRYLRKAYDESKKIYTYTMTTTYRPLTKDKPMNRMRRADPHYLCVPSLHISICCLTYSFYRMIFEREDFTQDEKERWLDEIRDHAIEISETVLYVKQHSVNCIPAALYMMTWTDSELFTPSEAVSYINRLFLTATDVSEEDKRKIVDHIQWIYERVLLEGAGEDDWTVPVKRWLDSYQNYEPFYAN